MHPSLPRFLIAVFVFCVCYSSNSQMSFEEEMNIPIRVGDVIDISMREDAEVQYHGPVDASGFVRMPYIREFRVVGMTDEQCAKALEEALTEELYQEASVTIRMVKRAPGIAYVYGAVKKPGAVGLPELGPMTVLQAISRADGLSAWAAADQCSITRFNPGTGEREEIAVNLISAFREIGGPEDIRLLPDDVIFVPAKNTDISQFLSSEPSEIIVVGQVEDPGIIKFAPGETRTFMRTIFKAGNFTRFAKKRAVRLISYRADGEREVRLIDAEKIIDEGFLEYDFELQPGDMIIVDEKLINF